MSRNSTRRRATSASLSTPTGGDPSMTPRMPRPRSVTATMTSNGFAVAQNMTHTSDNALIGLSTLTGKPSRSNTTKQCPAPIASAFAAAA
jgi:hypothetical protein